MRVRPGTPLPAVARAVAWVVAALAAHVVPVAGGPGIARAQSATVTLRASSDDVALDEVFVVEVRADVVNGRVTAVELPGLEAFEVRGRRMAQPLSLSFGFGGRTTTFQSSLVHTFELVPRVPGSHKLGPARVTVGTHVFQSEPLVVRVRPAGVGGPGTRGGFGTQGGGAVPGAPPDSVAAGHDGSGGLPGAPPGPPAGVLGGPTDAARYSPAGFLRTVIDDAEPYVGAQVTVTVYLYVPAPLHGSPVATREPSTDGFWTHDLLQGRPVQETQQVVRGHVFHVYPLRRFAAFPLRAGELTIGAMRVEVQTGGLFALFGPPPQPVAIEGVPLTVRVRDLPQAGRPAGPVYVGRFTLRTTLDRPSAQTGDAVTLTAVVEGVGNLRELRLPTPQVDGLDVLAPNIRDEPSAPGDQVGGRRSFEWLVVGTRPGRYRLGPIGFDAFDPRLARYTRVEAPALELAVAGAPVVQGGGAAAASGAGSTPEPSAVAGDEVPAGEDAAPRHGPLRISSALLRHRTPIADRPWFWPALLTPPGLFALLLFARLLARRARRAAAASRPSRVAREARRRLARARSLAAAGDARAFYAEVATALRALLEARLGEPVGALRLAELRAYLVERGMAEDLARRLGDELEGAEFARFSAAAVGAEEMREALGRATALAERLAGFVPAPKEGA
jgi:hypothetical protein